MPQSVNFLQFRTAFENASLPLELNNEVDSNSLKKLKKLFEIFGLTQFENVFPNELSGGMKQRLSLIQSFAINAPLRIFDEPLNALDYNSVIELTDIIWHKIKTEKQAAIFVTHDIEFAVSVSDRLIILKGNAQNYSEIQLNKEITQTTPSKRKAISTFKEISSKVVIELLN